MKTKKAEHQKLTAMLRENKITEADYKLLSDALSKETLCTEIEETLWINPFTKIAGQKSLIYGLVFFIIMSLLGTYSKVYLDGIFGAVESININTTLKPNFILLLYQCMVNCIGLGTVYYLSALICGQKRMRLIDFYGTVAFSRYPYIILIGADAIYNFVFPSQHVDLSKGYVLHFDLMATLFGFVWMGCYVWQMLTYFFAYKESSGLDGRRLWVSYLIATFLIGDTLSLHLSRIPFYLN